LTPLNSTSTSASDASLGSAIRLGAEIVVRLSSIVATLWLTRSLGVSTFGAFLLALSLGLMIAELCDLGLNAIVVPLIVRSRANLRTLFLMKAVMTVGVGLVAALLIPAAAPYSGLEASLLILTTIHFIGASWIEMTGTTLRALGRRKAEALLLFVFRFTLVSLVIGAPFGVSLWGASLAYALAIAPALATGSWLLRRPFQAPDNSGTSVEAILRQAAPMGVNGYLAILSTRVELFLLQAFGGEHVVGLFGGALRIVESLLTLPSAIAAGALPSVSRDVVTGSTGAAQRTFGLVVWLAVPAAVGIALCAPEVLHVLGPGFVEGTTALRILSIALFLCFSNAALIHVLIAAGDTLVIPKLTALRVGIAIMAGLLLIPRFGPPGAAISFTVAELVLFGTLVFRTRSHAVIEVHRPVLWALAASLPMVALLGSWTLSLPLSIAAGVLSFAIATAAILRRGTAASGLA
jgi:O-antigen/teichoic acid export membrane protein